MDNASKDILEKAIASLRAHENDVVFVKRQAFSLAELRRMDCKSLLSLLQVIPGVKIYKYCPFGKYTKPNILNNEVHLNNPDDFDDVFDSVSDADKHAFIRFRLLFYLRVLKCDFDCKLDNSELTKILFRRLGECAATIEDFRIFLKEAGIDDITARRLQIIYLNVIVSQYSNRNSIESVLIDEFDDYVQKHRNYRISCFTTDPTNLKMWSHYANDNRGLCIEYTVPNCSDLLVLSVAYSKIRGDSNYLVAVNDSQDVDQFIKTMFETVLRKDVCWIEQDEYRLICAKGEHEQDTCKFFPITGIYIGNKMKARNQAQIKHICKEKGIDCYYMQRSLSTFQLHPIKVEL